MSFDVFVSVLEYKWLHKRGCNLFVLWLAINLISIWEFMGKVLQVNNSFSLTFSVINSYCIILSTVIWYICKNSLAQRLPLNLGYHLRDKSLISRNKTLLSQEGLRKQQVLEKVSTRWCFSSGSQLKLRFWQALVTKVCEEKRKLGVNPACFISK